MTGSARPEAKSTQGNDLDKYQEIFMELPLPAVIISPEGLKEDVNEAFADSFPDKAMASEALAALDQDMARFRDSQEKNEMLEKFISFSNGESKTFRVRMSRLLSLNHKPFYLVIFTDITERRRQLDHILHLTSAIDSSDDAILSISLDYTIISWNYGAERIYGYTSDEIVGSKIHKILPECHHESFIGLLSEVAAGRHFIRFETYNLHKDKHVFPVSVTLSPSLYNNDIFGITVISRDISTRRQTEEELSSSHRRLKTLMNETVEALSTAHEKRDLYTSGHQRIVSMVGCCIADEMNLSQEQIEGIRIAGLLHDIGKICIPMEILSKPTALPREEMALMMEHPLASYEIVKNIPFPWPVKDIILQHHERVDGSGYPKGLKGEAILIEARILAVADVLEAMSSHRPYRQALGLEAALREIKEHAGTRYDLAVCQTVINLCDEGVIRVEGNKLVCAL